MRTSVLIAAMVLASAAAAQAGESRSLSTGTTNEATSITPASTPEPRAADATDTPRYTVRPSPTANTTTSAPPATASTAALRSRHPMYRPSGRSRQAMMMHQTHQRPHRGGVTVRRIIAALHRHGIYW